MAKRRRAHCFMISLTTPLMLAGLGLLALPIVAHLLHRRARRAVVFPSLALLREASLSQSHLLKLRRWLLLALRTLGVVCLVLAFTRPVWIAADAADPRQGAALVVVVDASASTSQESSGVALSAKLAGAASRAIGELNNGRDKANVVYAEARPRAVFSELSPNLPALRNDLADFKPSLHRADLPAAIAVAGKMLKDHHGPRRLVIVSDLQRSNWDFTNARPTAPANGDSPSSAWRLRSLIPGDTVVTVVDPAAAPTDNISLSMPKAHPPRPVLGQPIQATIVVANHSERAKQVRVAMNAPSQAPQEQTIALGAGEQREAVFQLQIPRREKIELVFSTAPDGLAADNQAYLLVEVGSRPRAAVISDDDPNEPGTSAYFLERALAPEGSNADRHDVQHISGADAGQADLTPFGMVVIGYLGELTPAAAARCVAHVRRGGGLLFFCGEGPAGQCLAALDREAGGTGLAPWSVGNATTFEAHEDGLRITSGKWQSRLLSEFDVAGQLALREIRFHRVWRPAAVRSDAQVLLAFDDGTPALGSRTLGEGKFFLASFSPSLKSSDLAKFGSFVAIMQILAKEMQTPAAGSRGHVVGESLRLSVASLAAQPDLGWRLLDPRGRPVTFTSRRQDNKLVFEVASADLTGVYRLQDQERVIAEAPVHLDRRESDLGRIKRADLESRIQSEGVGVAMQAAEGFSRLTPTRGTPLWGWFLFAGLAAVAAELAVVGLWRR